MGLEDASGTAPQTNGIEAERSELKQLLESRPLTRHLIDRLLSVRDAASRLVDKVVASPKVKDPEHGTPEDRFVESHDIVVADLNNIHYELGQLENIKDMFDAAQSLEWQSLDGMQQHKMFEEVETMYKNTKEKLEKAREVTVAKLESLMKLPFVAAKVHEDAVVEDEIQEMARPNSV